MDDPMTEAVQKFIAAVEARIAKQDARIGEQSEEIRSLRSELLTRSTAPQIEVREGPQGLPGRDGIDGKDGRDGVDGKDGIDGKDGAPGERGADGLNGRDGVPGERGERGGDGINGRDGAPGERGADSVIPGPKGDAGERGADGIATREELDALIERRFGEVQVRTFADIYQGVYQPISAYTRGQLVTWGGSLWLSLIDTRAKPGEGFDWKMIVKKGADSSRK